MGEEITNLENLENKFNDLLSKYQSLKKDSLENISENIELYNTENPYKNKNIKFTDNVIGYVTNENVFKKYPNGIQTIPGNVVIINIPFGNLQTGDTISTTPPLIVGTPITKKNQSVGDEGKNVIVSTNNIKENN
jgi:hypothetical protein